jgi:TM2 domain-containing membrane protein YozV
MKRKSEKSYAVAVCLSAIFGVLGIQHFYLGRWYEGMADLILTFGWLYYFVEGNPLVGTVFLGVDLIHSFITTVLLLTGTFKDGKGAYVCFPGQKL